MENNKNQNNKEPIVLVNSKYSIEVDGQSLHFDKPKVTGNEILEKAKKKPSQCFTLYQKLKGCDFEKISFDEIVDISNKAIEQFVTKEPEVFHYTVNGEPETIDRKSVSANEILKLNATDSIENYLVQVQSDGCELDFAYSADNPIKMECPGMTFFSRKWLDLVDIEAYGKECKAVPPARRYRLRVDKSFIDVAKPVISGHDLLVAAGKVPVEKFELFKVMSGQPKPQKIKDLHSELDLREKCLVRFVTLPKEQTEGRGNRVTFTLPVEDTEFLDNNGLPWEAIVEGNQWVLIKDHPLPEGYQVDKVDIALLIPPNYPAAEIDMAYFFPPLQKTSGRAIGAISQQQIDGRVYQRWSRHRAAGEWRPGLDNISTHMLLVNNWLENDLKK